MPEPPVTDRSLATPGRFSSRRMQGALVLLLGLPILLVGMAVLPRFDGLYGQDPFAYYDYATGPLRSALLALQLPPPFTWPPGYPLLVALVSFVLGTVPQAGQAVSLLAGALVLIFTALLAHEVWRVEGGGWSGPPSILHPPLSTLFVPLLAGLLAALVGQLWQSSVVVMADTTGLASATIGMWALARYGRKDSPRPASMAWLLFAAGTLAFAVLTRWAYALVAIPATAYALIVLARRGRATAFRHGLAAGLMVLLVFSPVILSTLRSILSPIESTVPYIVDLQVYSWNPLNALRREFVTSDGLLSYPWPNGLWYALAPAHRFYFTSLLAPLLLPGLWAVGRRRAAAPLFLLVGWIAAIFIFHAGAPWQNFRFNLAHLPPLAILVAIGVETIALWLVRRLHNGTVRRLALLVLTGYVLTGMLLMARGGWRLTQSFVDRKNTELALVRQVEAKVQPDAQLVTFGLTLTFQHYSHLPTYEIYYLDEPALKALASAPQPLYVLLNLDNVETQWQGETPEGNYRWLQEHTKLRPVADLVPYTLFEAQPTP